MYHCSDRPICLGIHCAQHSAKMTRLRWILQSCIVVSGHKTRVLTSSLGSSTKLSSCKAFHCVSHGINSIWRCPEKDFVFKEEAHCNLFFTVSLNDLTTIIS